ncbi:zinc finger with UFM1-specific peptidase domain protein [Rhypophila sp. PSN 637]
METLHPEEGDSPFTVKLDATNPSTGNNVAADELDLEYIDCLVDGCGELLPRSEMDYHLELHAEEAGVGEPTSSPSPETTPVADSGAPSASLSGGPSPSSRSHHRRDKDRDRDRDRERERDKDGSSRNGYSERSSHHRKSHPTPKSKAISAWKSLFKMPSLLAPSSPKSRSSRRDHASDPVTVAEKQASGKRLGKAQLGRYAHEEQMPDWLVAHLQKGGQVSSEGVIPVLAQLLEHCPTTKYAYLCHPSVQHVSKLKKEGGFCGYRNIQMLASYINAVNFKGYRHFEGKIPSIFKIQDFIERAWDHGINSAGRLETGGIKGTRKYIGTPEALAMFRVLEIPCDAQGFKHREPGKSEALMLDEVEAYFQSGVQDPTQRVRRTHLPPVYFQHAGHSMSIIGLEKQNNGGRSLLVFDPMFKDASNILKLVGRFDPQKPAFKLAGDPDGALKSYRRGNRYLRRYREFEILRAMPMEDYPVDSKHW